MHPRHFVLVAGLLALFPGQAQAQSRTWALVVGIDDYVHLQGVEGGDLLGAENDAAGFVDYLTRGLEVPEEQILVLAGADATATALRRGLKTWLGERARASDRVYFFFSGHGSQVLDDNGDEEDGLDETLAPADALPFSPANDLLDDEIASLLEDLEAREIIVILDSCSSGTATKTQELTGRPRRLHRPVARPKGLATDSRGSGFVDVHRGRIVELAAAAPNQTALDATFLDDEGNVSFHGGAFTTHLLAELWAAADSATLLSVLHRARDAMSQDLFEQEPQFSGSPSARVNVTRR